MRRRECITLIGSAAAVSLLLLPVARAQEPGRIYRLGVIAGPARQAPRILAFFDELKGLGFVEGHNLQIVAGGFGLREDQSTEVAATVAKSAPDVILCTHVQAVRAMQEATHTFPIVGTSGDMVAVGFVRSFARPGGNTTGVSLLSFELNGKRQEILMEAVPGARRIAVLVDPLTEPAHLQALQNAARARGVEVAVFTAGAPEQIAPTMDKAKEWGANALNVLSAPLSTMAANARLLAVYVMREFAMVGGLMSYGASFADVYRRLAGFADQIIKGTGPADLPIQRPTKFELVINLKTSKALGLTISESLLLRADEVIE